MRLPIQHLALGLLAAAALLYVIAAALHNTHPAWDYVAAFAEAAMVGAMADWFAVVALFRHPLGLPIPHTAIVPANKARIGENLADFICAHFLSDAQVLAKLREFDAGARLAGWLAQPANAQAVGRHLVALGRYGLAAFDDDRLRRWLRVTIVRKLETVDFAELAGRLLDVLTADRRHQAMLDEVLMQIALLLDDEAVQQRIAGAIGEELGYLRYLGLKNVAGNFAANKLVSGVGRLLGEMAADPQHELRLKFDDFVAQFIDKLKHDPAFRLRGEQIRDQALRHPALSDWLRELWRDLLGWLRADLAREDSAIGARISAMALTLGRQLADDRAMQDWINEQVLAAAPPLVARYREDIRRYIVARVMAWETEAMTAELERNLGRDLQWVRINGTVVGGLIGLLIFAVTRAVAG
ncbi:DUF445 domain-containing protein [Derxia gummosa]|uniref:DUF445 domain-containing protein n=1 Tax=Derxia gummosa DSM 723 TaxID=1121388 RepID=A0A9U5CCU9_9BURK|nr:DUF445 domain-containing protein [Derxia gummosa]